MSGVDLSQQAAMLSKGMAGVDGTGYFGPGRPITPTAPENFGWYRAFDYSIGANVTIAPKAIDGGLTYRQLRDLAENCDYIAIAIQSVLDRLCATPGRVVDTKGDGRKPSAKADEVNDWLAFPDGITPLHEFLQMAAYDMCVIDAASVAVDKTIPSKPKAYVIDGATVVAHLDERGVVSSLGQVIKGTIAHEYNRDQIIWMPKNRRPHKAYGYSFVQQIQSIVSLALRRSSRQLDWFSKGNIPDALLVAPTGWTPQQVKDASENWAKQMAGIGGKNQMAWMPPGTTIEKLDRNPTVSEYDEWLIRVICFAFSLPPTAFVKQVNRSTSETMQDASITEGHGAILRWAENLLTAIIRSAWGPGFKWSWSLADPTKEEIIKILPTGYLKPSALLRLGLTEDEIADPVAERAEAAKVAAETAKASAESTAKNAPKPEEKDKSGVQNGAILNGETDGDDLEKLIQGYLDDLKTEADDVAQKKFAGEFVELIGPAPRGFVARATVLLQQEASKGIEGARSQTPRIPENMTDAYKPAAQYAKDRAAEMVGMRWDGAKLIPNPNAQWQISDVVRDAVRTNVSKAFEEGWTPQELSQNLAMDHGFSAKRARNISRTEIATAQEEGARQYFKAAGVTGKRWSQSDACPVCQGNAKQGVIPVEQAFQSGHQHGPAHPSCRCSVIPEELPA